MDAITTLEMLKAGTLTPEQAVQDAIAKIEKENPELNAAAEILSQEAYTQLQNLPEGSLKGLPISVKECFAVAGRKITSGSKRMQPIECVEDATVIQKLKAAGAVIVARGNTSEFLLGREADNLLDGATGSSINPALTSGGSSGGDASLVGSGCVTIGIGTDIGGSCRYPAVFNGIAGFKPASGQIDKTGIFPVSGNEFNESMNSPGLLSRSVRDARLVYNIIADKILRPDGNIKDIKIYTSNNFRVKIKDKSISQALEDSINQLQPKVKSITDISIPEAGRLFRHFNSLMTGGFGDKIYEWSTTPDGKNLSFFKELFGRFFGRKTLSDEVFAMLPAFNLLKPSARKLEKIIQECTALRTKYYGLLDGVLILPTVGILAPPKGKFYPQYNKPGVIDIITPVSFCNVLNLSCITLPVWKFQANKEASPPAVMLITAPGKEEILLNVAEALERLISL